MSGLPQARIAARIAGAIPGGISTFLHARNQDINQPGAVGRGKALGCRPAARQGLDERNGKDVETYFERLAELMKTSPRENVIAPDTDAVAFRNPRVHQCTILMTQKPSKPGKRR